MSEEKKSHKDNFNEPLPIIEEKVVKGEGKVEIRKYEKGKYLGKGGFAKCYEFHCLETDKFLAAKIISKETLSKNRAKQKLMSEIRIHRSIKTQHVVRLEHFFEDAENVYILLEMCKNQTLNELIRRRKKLTELEAQCYLLQVLDALKYMHSHRIIHRDLKLGNLFLTEKMEIKVGDFGLATKLEFEGERKRTVCGTPNYIAPEILEGKNGHSYEVDIWSVGVILFTIVIGKPPFETSDVKATYKKIKANSYSFPENCTISTECKNLIKAILNSDPSKRPKIEEIEKHPFLTKNEIPILLPISTLACPPSNNFIKQYIEGEKSNSQNPKIRLESTGSYSNIKKTFQATSSNNFMGTERIGRKSSEGKIVLKEDNKFEKNQFNSDNEEGKILNEYNEIYVKKWIDYSSKYGLGYRLSNGITGVYFNDSSKIILKLDNEHFNYYDRKKDTKIEEVFTHSITNYPKDLQKKVILLQHFKNYLDKELKEEGNKKAINVNNVREEYVKKWLHSKHAIIFRLSNKIVQVSFEDKTEIILSSEDKNVVYLNKKGERWAYHLYNALESKNGEMTKRLKYTKDILTQMLKSKSKE